ncbi:MAG: hypothetical protein HQL84_19030 [Magnetococcales bacterium]|nr:hypothetical protein [Magnetococcales bacterium]
MIDSIRREAEIIIRRAIDNDLSIEEACYFLSTLDNEICKDVCIAIHAVIHFITDTDIRQADHEYDKLLRDGLISSIKLLNGEQNRRG